MSRICDPTVRGEIKKARAGNYDTNACIFEFIDNALDAGADRIRVDVRERSGGIGYPHKILISDNVSGGVSSDKLCAVFSWTFERQRSKDDIGEYGVGFKAASVNLADKLTLITHHDGRSYQVMADWQDMADENRWEPKVFDIQNDYYNDTHPYQKGSTFILEGLRHEMFSGSTTEKKWLLIRLYEDIAYHYRYLFQENPALVMTVRGVWETGGETTERDIRLHDLFQSNTEPAGARGEKPCKETVVRVYQDTMQFYRVYFQNDSKKWEQVEFVDRRKNGNSILRYHEVSAGVMDNMRLVDTLAVRSFHILDIGRSAVCLNTHPTCTMDLIRKGRVVGRDLTLRAPRAEPFSYFVKHEVWYGAHAINHLLGVQYNKQNHGVLRDNDLRYTLEYIQQSHERDILKIERLHQAASSLCQKTPVDAAPVDAPVDVPVDAPVDAPVDVQRRRNFSSQTKIETLHRQECRDSVLDFVLRDGILLMEYDHKNGMSGINSKDNCQALSVITHSIKTRCPVFFQEELMKHDPAGRIAFIVELLNCITRSKYFLEAWTAGTIITRQPHQLSAIQQGIFELIP